MKKKLLTTPIIAIVIFVLLGGSIGFATIYLGGSGRTDEINLQKGLIGHWTLDGNAKDSTPYNNHGTIYGASSTADRKGQSGKALSFDGVNDYVEVPDSATLFKDGFESGDLSAWDGVETNSGDLTVAAGAKLHGSYGLNCFINDTNYSYVEDDFADQTRVRIRFYIDPNNVTIGSFLTLVPLKMYTSAWSTIGSVILRYDSSSYDIAISARLDDNSYSISSYYDITDAPHCIEIDWKKSSGANDGFLSLWIDGVLKQTLSSLDNDIRSMGMILFGAVDIDEGTSGTIFLDDFASNNTGTPIGLVGSASLDITNAITVEGWAKKNSQTILFKDGFESGNTAAWSSETDADNDLTVTEAAKLHGTYGLAASIDDTHNMYVQDTTPSAETRYRVRFYVDPNSITMANGDAIILLWVYDAGWEHTIFRVSLKKNSGVYQILVYIDTVEEGFLTTITDAPHCIEVDWKAGVADGFLKFWLDGVLIDQNTTADDFTAETIIFGVYNSSVNISGTFFLDDFASNNTGTLIGPVGYLASKGENAYALKLDEDGSNLRGDINNTEISASVSNPTEWHHYALTYDGSNQKLYIDGILATTTSKTGSINTNSTNLRIGEYFNGFIDDVHIYNRALSAGEIKALYESYDPALRVSDLQKGLVGHWTLDGNAKDSTPYGNNGTIYEASSTADRKGKANGALSFDGIDDRVNASSTGVNTAAGANNTVAFWMYWNGNTNNPSVFGFNNSYPNLWFSSDNCFGVGNWNWDSVGISSTGLANRWVHVAFVFYNGTPSPTNSKMYIDGVTQNISVCTGTPASGSAGGTINLGTTGGLWPWGGKLDEVRIYNRALSEAEIKALYESYDPAPRVSDLQKGLVAHWTLDGNAKDSTPYNNHGTIYEASSTADRKGKANGALSFDGVNDYVDAGTGVTTGNIFTIEGWFNSKETRTWRVIISKTVYQEKGWYLWNSPTGVWLDFWDGATEHDVNSHYLLPFNTWTHLVIVINNINYTAKFYINGYQLTGISEDYWGPFADNSGVPLYIGMYNDGGYNWTGLIDEVRIYNRALSAAEIKALYESYQ